MTVIKTLFCTRGKTYKQILQHCDVPLSFVKKYMQFLLSLVLIFGNSTNGIEKCYIVRVLNTKPKHMHNASLLLLFFAIVILS